MENNYNIQNSIIADLSEGVMTVRQNGRIEMVNDAALSILQMKREELVGCSFAACFFTDGKNDAFTETVLDSIREKDRRHEGYVPYFIGEKRKELRVVSSYLREKDEVVGIILVISDITELSSLRDSVQAMERIQTLNQKLELRNRLLKDTFGRYLSDDIVREILDTPDGMRLGGQKRRVTVMMSDLHGFTMMCERTEPQALVAMLNHYFAEMYEEISRYGGTIIEFLGDGMFILFGAPVPSATHASDAVACAVAMQKRMRRVNEWNEKKGYERLTMGIGIHTDQVILGNIGSEKRTKYGVMGHAVNLTGRIESYTTEGQILISPETRHAVREPLEIVRTFPVSPKGVREELVLSQVAGIGGDYGLFLDKDEDRPVKLAVPVGMKFCRVTEKHVQKPFYTGTIVALSERQAVMRTAAEVPAYSDVMLDIGEDLYGKVTQCAEGKLWVCFTAKPACFADWVLRLKDGRPCG